MKKKILSHHAVEEFYTDDDGHWIVLKDGYNYYGCCSIRQSTLRRLYESLSEIKEENEF